MAISEPRLAIAGRGDIAPQSVQVHLDSDRPVKPLWWIVWMVSYAAVAA